MSHILYLKTVDIVKKFFSDAPLQYISFFLKLYHKFLYPVFHLKTGN